MDKVDQHLAERWKRLGETAAIFCQPWLDIDAQTAREKLDPDGILGDLRGKSVLCLAGGGGQQSVAFGLSGARVTVLDVDGDQLQRDLRAAAHHGFTVRIEQGDMRDLSRFGEGAFDIVWHPYSVNFVPQFATIVAEVARVLRPEGIYTFMLANPFASGIGTKDWNGEGYVMRLPYIDGAAYEFDDEDWVNGGLGDVPRPKEFRHTLGRVVRDLTNAGFVLFRLDEVASEEPESSPGTWQHLTSFMPPWFTLWTKLGSEPFPLVGNGA